MAERPNKSPKENLSDEAPSTQVSGFQEGIHYPPIPVTKAQFQQLLSNPDKPAENQSAPSQEKLNPHLFGPQGRL